MGTTKVERKTKETEISLELNLTGTGKSKITTGIGFFDHMLELLAFHSDFDLLLKCKGDLQVDGHHTIEDVGIVFGQAFKKSLPENTAIVRYATAFAPMDESLARVVVDVSGRPYLAFEAEFAQSNLGSFETELVKEFFKAFVNHAQITLHVQVLYGENAHHKIESMFKATALALKQAVQTVPQHKRVSSTKGVL